MTLKDILESYNASELRVFIKAHNKKQMKLIEGKIKAERIKLKSKLLVIVTKMKKPEVIAEMLKHSSHFKNIKEKAKVSFAEQNDYAKNMIPGLLVSAFQVYAKAQDLDELEDYLDEMYAAIKKKGLLKRVPKKNKFKAEVIKEVKSAQSSKPARPVKPPVYVFKNGKLTKKNKAPRPAKPTRKAPTSKVQTHTMADGTVMTGASHSKDSKPIGRLLRRPKKVKTKKAPAPAPAPRKAPAPAPRKAPAQAPAPAPRKAPAKLKIKK